MLHYLPVTFSFQIQVWSSNPNQFVEDEDDDTFSYSVRIAAQDVLLVCQIICDPKQSFPETICLSVNESDSVFEKVNQSDHANQSLAGT